jgi:hypothetical protein
MSPVTHTLLQLALPVLGGVGGGWSVAALCHEGRVKSLAPHTSLPHLIGALAGFFIVFVFWDRLVPLCCPVCGGKMTKVYGEGRHLVFRCTSLGIRH